MLLLCALANLAVVRGFMSDTDDVSVSVNFLQECVPSENGDDEDDGDGDGNDEDDDGHGHDDDDDEDDDEDDGDGHQDDGDEEEDDGDSDGHGHDRDDDGQENPGHDEHGQGHGYGHDGDDDDDEATPNPEHDLKGHKVNDSTGKIVNKSHNCKYPVGIASYKRFDNVAAHQELFDWKTQWIPPDQILFLQVALPDCAAQVYLFYDGVLFTMTSQGYGDRLLKTWKVNGNHFCTGPP